MRLLLVRHGESTGNVTRVLQGRDDPLTERGRRQARAIARHLAARGDVQAIYTSPLARAYETARIIGAAVGVEPEPREGFAEIDVGQAAGLTLEEWIARFPAEEERFQREGLDFVWPGGESGRQLAARTAAETDHIIDRHRNDAGAVVVVSHGGALAWIVGHLLQESRDTWPRHPFDNCSLTEVDIDVDDPHNATFMCHNEVGHLSPEPDEEVATGRA